MFAKFKDGRMTEKRLGRFELSRSLLFEFQEDALLIMRDLLVCRCEDSFATDTTKYIAFSKHFDIVPENAIVPEYDVRVTDNKEVIWSKV